MYLLVAMFSSAKLGNNMDDKLTLGANRVRTNFNPSALSPIDELKRMAAAFIDKMEALKNDVASLYYDQDPAVYRQEAGECLRLIALAQTAAEEAAMWGVKALTDPIAISASAPKSE